MRRLALALLVVLCLAAPALGDVAAKKRSVDARIASLHGRLAAQKQQAARLQSTIADYTSRIRTLEAKVGDVSLHLQTLEADLALRERRLHALDQLYRLQTQRYVALRSEEALARRRLSARLVEIYEGDQPSSLDVLLGSSSVQQALDRVEAIADIGAQDRRVAAEVETARRDVQAARAKTTKLRPGCAARRPSSPPARPRRARCAMHYEVPKAI